MTAMSGTNSFGSVAWLERLDCICWLWCWSIAALLRCGDIFIRSVWGSRTAFERGGDFGVDGVGDSLA